MADSIILELGSYSKKFFLSENPIPVPINLGWNVDAPADVKYIPLDGYKKLVSLYGSPKVVRIFSSPGKGILPWTDPLMQALPSDVVLIYSVKDWPVSVSGWLSSRPTRFTRPVYFCVNHEPEQGPTKGDPTPSAYQARWSQLVAQLNNHPRRSEIKLTPIFTEEYARKNKLVFEANFFTVVKYGVDAIGFDIYDDTATKYRTAEERNRIPLQYARSINKELIIPEWGIIRKSYDADGSIAAAHIRENMYYLNAQPDVSHVAWFHTDSWAVYNRPQEQAALKGFM